MLLIFQRELCARPLQVVLSPAIYLHRGRGRASISAGVERAQPVCHTAAIRAGEQMKFKLSVTPLGVPGVWPVGHTKPASQRSTPPPLPP